MQGIKFTFLKVVIFLCNIPIEPKSCSEYVMTI